MLEVIAQLLGLAAIDPVSLQGTAIGFAKRAYQSSVIVGSPALAAETIICQVTATENEQVAVGVFLFGSMAYTVGTSGTSARYRLRQTGLAGNVIYDSGATTAGIAATNLVTQMVCGVDTASVLPNQIYVLTLQVGAGAAASTVSATNLLALVL